MIVYRLISPSLKSYIGKTVYNFEKRFNRHIHNWKTNINANRKHKSKLYSAFDKYLPETWKVEILYCCLNEQELNDKEKYYIKYYDSIDHGYNLCRGGEGVFGFKHSKETKKKFSNFRKGMNKGIKLSQETKNNISISLKGHKAWNRGLTCSEETKRKMSESHKGKIPWNKGIKWENIANKGCIPWNKKIEENKL